MQAVLGVTADGDFGPGTERAVKAWQTSKGLTADGVVGPKTLAAMKIS
jgi:peptidoglycan hydrolase-like protein with peptidoglycan-binding domain